ncbi:DUF2637 domain-containing protein [Microbispora sp. KK1-11]|uniref:DUF2637 domain-containing protein n=1 Tax=Microbispora sp. KK1-11 TaxID=2053005 RepID=UPI00115C3AD8|nr:DUF2637 domain-containing protein [Microbispora sp. KK1-11]TQS29101.1 DUF2637 domain-containing protein [Microbispora sp. KK1-11]
MRDPNDGAISAPDLTTSEPDAPPADHPAQAVPAPSRAGRLWSWLRRDRAAEAAAGAEADAVIAALREPSPADVSTASRPPSGAVPLVRRGRPSKGESIAVAALGGLLVALIAVAFRGSWTAHRDAALGAHFDPMGAGLYPFAPDGLIIIALVAAMVLRHSRGARFYCLTVVALFTGTSYVINHLHGLGWFAIHPGTAELVKPLPWPVVALVALQVIAAIFFGSHILVHVFRHLFPSVGSDSPAPLPTTAARPEVDAGTAPEGDPEQPETPPAAVEPDPREVAKLVYRACLEAGVELSRKRLSTVTGISERQAGYIKTDVEVEVEDTREDVSPEAIRQRVTAMRAAALMADDALTASVNGSAPTGRTNGVL